MKNMNKVLIIIVVSIIVLVVGKTLITIHNFDEKAKIIRNDKQPIINIFPNLGEFEEFYWKAGTIGEKAIELLPTPSSSYWIKGFVKVDKEKISDFMDKYNMQEISPSPKLDFFPKNFDTKTSKWFSSNEFNVYMHHELLKHNYMGEFYIESVNQVIYFDITSINY